MELRDVERILREHREELRRRFKVREIGIFESYVKGEAKETSDVDILVDFYEATSLFEFIEIDDVFKRAAWS